MQNYISIPRLNSYKSILKLTKDDQINRAYFWSIALSGSIYPLMHTLEITFRNALDHSVKTHHRPVSTIHTSLAGDPLWFEKLVTILQDQTIAKLKPKQKRGWIDANNRRLKYSYNENLITKTRKDASKEKAQVLPSDILSRVPFGFWTSMLDKSFEDVTNQNLLWPNLMTHVFPNLPRGKTLNDIEKIFTNIRCFRNRLSHHEPIWKFFNTHATTGELNYSDPVYGLAASISLLNQQYDQMLEVIEWISADAYQNFKDAKMHYEFKKLCSLDGFYGFVKPEKITNTKPTSKAKREFFKTINNSQQCDVIYMKSNKKKGLVLGINEPNLP